MRIHYIEQDNYMLAFFPDTLRFFEINEKTKEVINSYLNSENESTASKKFNMSIKEYRSFIDKLKECSISSLKPLINTKKNTNSSALGRLILNVSNKCNLRCKYCYANGGVYNSNEDLMSIDTLKKSLDVFYDRFTSIEFIQIFGGEPTLNIPAIEYICRYIELKYNDGEIPSIPQIGIVSNGTIITEDLVKLIKKYHIKMTISFDGDPTINDKMRVFPDGTGTSNIIIKNIKRLKEETGEPSTIEVTYNKHHETSNVSIVDIINFINNNFSHIPIHIAPACGSSECSYVIDDCHAFIDSVDDIFQNITNGNLITYSLIQRIINALNTKQYTSCICGAGIDSLSVSTKGDIYPCFMFTDDESLKMGNVYNNDIFKSDTYVKFKNQFTSFNKFENKKCSSCFINKLCNGCLGTNYIENGKVFELSEVTCDMYKRMVEKVIINLHAIKKKSISNKECEA